MGLLVGPVLAEVPDLFLGEEVRIVFEEELPSGRHYLEGRILAMNQDWLILVDRQRKIYWCSVSRIVYIEMLRIKQGGKK